MAADQSTRLAEGNEPDPGHFRGVPVPIGRILIRGLVLTVGIGLLYLMEQQVVPLFAAAKDLREIKGLWFLAMAAAEVASFVCMWALIRRMLPTTSWFVVATSQLVSNSVSRVAGGAAAGGAALYRMLAVGGVKPNEAAGAMAATSVVSNALLFAIPAVAGLLALVGAPIPERLLPAAIAGGVFFILLLLLAVVAIAFDRPLLAMGRVGGRIASILGRVVRRQWGMEPQRLLDERERLVSVLDDRWPGAVVAAAGNWAFDYMALIMALYAVGAEPRLSLVLLAYAGASVLNMVPFTPGGVGFVEVGLVSTLVISGIPAREAGIATIGYRAVSLLLPLVAGPLAWLVFKLKFPTLNRAQPAQ